MPARKRARPRPSNGGAILHFRLRIVYRGMIALGPGKIELLRAIEAHESISKGAKSLGMSYMRAWTLVKVMNAAFREPLIELKRGGARGGKAQVTNLGREVLDLYSNLIEQCQTASQEIWVELQRRLSK